MDKKSESVDLLIELVHTAFDIQELYLKKSEYNQLSMSEMHVLEAVSKESEPSMSAVARRLKITTGTLTTAVKRIMEKGFLIKERSAIDQRIFYLRLTQQGQDALKVHDKFHMDLSHYIETHIPVETMDWVQDTMKLIYADLMRYRENLINDRENK